MIAPEKREKLLSHAAAVAILDREKQEQLLDLVNLALQRYSDGWSEKFDSEMARLSPILEHLDRALAALLASSWTFAADDEFWAFRDADEAYAWLQGKGPNLDCPRPDGHFDRLRDWRVRSLWDLREDVESELGDILAHDKARWKHHWSRPPSTSSRLPQAVEELIFDVCQAWHDLVDPRLGLPRRDPDPWNPLLLFLDECLAIALGDDRPSSKTLLQLVSRHLRPAIRKDDQLRERETTAATDDAATVEAIVERIHENEKRSNSTVVDLKTRQPI